jgi:ribonuclease HI
LLLKDAELGVKSTLKVFGIIPETPCIVFSQSHDPLDCHLTLHGEAISRSNSVKILGLIFDRKMTWKNHIDYLKQKCHKSLNILKMIKGTDWGADRATMVHLYKSIVRSKLDYCCQVYGSAKPSLLQKLDPIQNLAFRLATGALRTSPVASLLAEVNELPLEYRRIYMTVSYFTKLKSRPHSPAFKVTTSNSYSTVYASHPNMPAPLGLRCASYLQQLGYNLPEVIPYTNPAYPPWFPLPVQIDLTVCSLPKSTTAPEVYQQHFYNVLHTAYADHHKIYTDGSKSAAGSASAFIDNTSAHTFNLLSETSVYIAELLAIKFALERILNSGSSPHYVICSDSTSSLLSIQNGSNALLNTIRNLLFEITARGITVSFLWTPAHSGIRGNEEANSAAKHPPSTSPVYQQADTRDVARHTANLLARLHQRDWDQYHNSAKLYKLKHHLSNWKTAERPTNRREEIVMARLRIGHCSLTHNYLLQRVPAPACPKCDVFPLTVHHILLDCPFSSNLLSTFNLPRDITLLLADDPVTVSNLISFLKATALYSLI